MNALTHTDYFALSPLLILVGAALLPLLFESYFRKASQTLSAVAALVGILAALWAFWVAPASTHPLLTPWVTFDATQKIFSFLFLLIGLASVILSYAFLKNRDEESEGEYYFLLMAALFGLLLIAMSADFLTLFLGIETLSLSLYVLCAYLKKWQLAQESALKYFFLGALSSAFLLFGIALIYGAAGTTNFSQLLQAYKGLGLGSSQFLFLSGVAMVTLALAFKAAIVPFHTWAPDVYEGASTPVTAFMSVGTKAGAFAAFVRIFIDALPQFCSVWSHMVALLAIPTLIYANWVALKQNQLRRFFAYSGISHAGYLLLAVAAGTEEARQAISTYLIIYTLATLAAFAVILILEKKQEGLLISDLRGLFHEAPVLAGILAIAVLTLAGIPPLAGFFAKFYIFKAAWGERFYFSVFVALAAALLGAYYYTRILVLMFMEKGKEEARPKDLFPAGIVAVVCFIFLIWFSLYPAPLFSF